MGPVEGLHKNTAACAPEAWELSGKFGRTSIISGGIKRVKANFKDKFFDETNSFRTFVYVPSVAVVFCKAWNLIDIIDLLNEWLIGLLLWAAVSKCTSVFTLYIHRNAAAVVQIWTRDLGLWARPMQGVATAPQTGPWNICQMNKLPVGLIAIWQWIYCTFNVRFIQFQLPALCIVSNSDRTRDFSIRRQHFNKETFCRAIDSSLRHLLFDCSWSLCLYLPGSLCLARSQT